MPKIRRGGYVFISWRSDHPWDLDNEKPMKGRASRRVIELIEQLREERLI